MSVYVLGLAERLPGPNKTQLTSVAGVLPFERQPNLKHDLWARSCPDNAPLPFTPMQTGLAMERSQ